MGGPTDQVNPLRLFSSVLLYRLRHEKPICLIFWVVRYITTHTADLITVITWHGPRDVSNRLCDLLFFTHQCVVTEGTLLKNNIGFLIVNCYFRLLDSFSCLSSCIQPAALYLFHFANNVGRTALDRKPRILCQYDMQEDAAQAHAGLDL